MASHPSIVSTTQFRLVSSTKLLRVHYDGGENAMVSPLSHVLKCNEFHRGLILNYNFSFSCKRNPSFMSVELHAGICRVTVYHRPDIETIYNT